MISIPYLDLSRSTAAIAPLLQEAAITCIASGWFVLGERVQEFEDAWSLYNDVEHTVGVSNGLDGLELALRACGVGPRDEVVVPSNTYIATWLAVTNVGATPVPVEPDPATSLIDVAGIRGVRTDRTKAVLPVHLFGRMCDRAIEQYCAVEGLKCIADAAQAHGARDEVGEVGGYGDAAVFSFYPTKNLGALGDAGAVCTNDGKLAAKVRLLRNYGSPSKYKFDTAGRNARLDELQAAFLTVKLPFLREQNRRRAAIAEAYGAAFDAIGLEHTPVTDKPANVYHVFNIFSDRRDALASRLTTAGIGTQVFYPQPPHKSGAYAMSIHLPIAERLAATSLALPMAPYLTDSEVQRVINAVERAVLARN